MTEDAARGTLRELHSPAYDPAKYVARRVSRGWLFSWRPDVGSPLVGSRPWVVAENGRARSVPLRRAYDEVLGELMATDGR